jgi:hypothetical protein
MNPHELIPQDYRFNYSGYDYVLHTFSTPDGQLGYRFWRKVDEGMSKPSETRDELIRRVRKQLET